MTSDAGTRQPVRKTLDQIRREIEDDYAPPVPDQRRRGARADARLVGGADPSPPRSTRTLGRWLLLLTTICTVGFISGHLIVLGYVALARHTADRSLVPSTGTVLVRPAMSPSAAPVNAVMPQPERARSPIADGDAPDGASPGNVTDESDGAAPRQPMDVEPSTSIAPTTARIGPAAPTVPGA